MFTHLCQRCGKDFNSISDNPTKCSQCWSDIWDTPLGEKSTLRRGKSNDTRQGRTSRVHERRTI
jgi:DNA-directed RNA polymerase subunit RPC12/RpoP